MEKVDWEVISHGKKDDNQARIPELYQKYIKRGQEFSEKYASEKEAPVMLFRAGVALAHFGHETESTNIFDKLILRFPKSKPALLAANDMLKSKVAAGAWREASRLSEKFKKANIGDQFQSFSKAQLASDFNIALSVFDAAEIERTKCSIEKANLLYEESANLYLKILSTDSKFEDGPKALFNAAQAYKLSGQLAKADQLFENLAKTFPKHKLAKTSKKENAIFAENNFRFARAAKAYQALIGNTPKLEKTEKQDLMLSIALMFELAQENKNSAQAFLDYANKYPTSKNSLQARFSAAKLFEKAGDAKSQRNTLNKIILIQPTADNAAILAEVALSLGKIELKKCCKT